METKFPDKTRIYFSELVIVYYTGNLTYQGFHSSWRSMNSLSRPSLQTDKTEWFDSNDTLFDDGWYLFQQGALSGPYLAHELFHKQADNLGNKEAGLVSRKGFDHWYAIHQICEVYANKPGIKANIQPAKKPETSLEENLYQADVKDCFVEYGNLLTKGRLRLGLIHGEEKSILWYPLTLGLCTYFWYQKALTEVLYHLDDPLASLSRQGDFWVLLPFLVPFKFYHLAKLILQMEVQNNYRKTKPLVAFCLAWWPPFAQIYLQKKLNHHWALHINHAQRTGLIGTLLANTKR